ncbi:MAG: hypothetical protein IJA73_04035 [Oscillospiraceae bacterium]|nr:hypothetical protein [Oscillospiraceae bacterium]
MELKLKDGDYVADGYGGLVRVSGSEELLQRVLFRLCVRRGSFPFLPTLGSRLHQLGAQPRAQREAAAHAYAAEALSEEKDIAVQGVTLTGGEDGETKLIVHITWKGEALDAAVTLQ